MPDPTDQNTDSQTTGTIPESPPDPLADLDANLLEEPTPQAGASTVPIASLRAERAKRQQAQQEAAQLSELRSQGWLDAVDKLRAQLPPGTSAEEAAAILSSQASRSRRTEETSYYGEDDPVAKIDPVLSRLEASVNQINRRLTAREEAEAEARRRAQEQAEERRLQGALATLKKERYRLADPDAVLHRITTDPNIPDELDDATLDGLMREDHRRRTEEVRALVQERKTQRLQAEGARGEVSPGPAPPTPGETGPAYDLKNEDDAARHFAQRAREAFEEPSQNI